MSLAKDNEKMFFRTFPGKVKDVVLLEQKIFSIIDDKNRLLKSSVDYHFVHNDRDILIEIDSYNMAKVVIGQYLLINQFSIGKLKNPCFLVIHTYKNYKPERTIKYLEFVNKAFLNNSGIPFGVIHIDDFNNWPGGNVSDFLQFFNV